MKVTWRRRKTSYLSGPVLEPKGMHVIFQKNGKKWQKMAKYLKIGVKMYKIWKYFEKGQPHMCGYRMHETAQVYPGFGTIGWILMKFSGKMQISITLKVLKVWLQPLSRQHLGSVWKNHAIYQNNELAFEEKKKAKSFQEVQMNIY